MSSHKEYSNIELSTEVLTATPHKQVELLLDKCLQHIHTAKRYISEKQMTQKHEAISKALDILTYLRSILNFKDKEATELSNTLSVIYASSEKNLAMANLKNDASFLDHVITVLTEIKTGWDGIR